MPQLLLSIPLPSPGGTWVVLRCPVQRSRQVLRSSTWTASWGFLPRDLPGTPARHAVPVAEGPGMRLAAAVRPPRSALISRERTGIPVRLLHCRDQFFHTRVQSLIYDPGCFRCRFLFVCRAESQVRPRPP